MQFAFTVKRPTPIKTTTATAKAKAASETVCTYIHMCRQGIGLQTTYTDVHMYVYNCTYICTYGLVNVTPTQHEAH